MQPDISTQQQTLRTRSAWRRWAPLGVAVVALLIFRTFDGRLKQSASPGYCPAQVDWVAASEDFGAFWAGIEQSDVLKTLEEQIPDPLRGVVLAARQTTGIRPTPARWDTWMGPRLLCWQTQNGLGACVRPGLLMRAVHLWRTRVLGTDAKEGVYACAGYSYQWRNGFLILGTSPEIVLEATGAPPTQLEEAKAPNELRVAFHAPCDTLVRVRGADGIPIAGWCRIGITRRDSPLTLSRAWPRPPMGYLATSQWRDATAIMGLLAQGLSGLPDHALLSNFAQRLLEKWQVGSLAAPYADLGDECALALMDLTPSSFPPLPSIAIVARPRGPMPAANPFAKWFPMDQAMPFEWNGRPGTVIPWLGEELMICLGRTDQNWVLTTQEGLMADFASMEASAEPVDADAVMHLDWRRLAGSATSFVSQAAQLELLPGISTQDLQYEISPLIQAVAQLGALEVTGYARNDRIVFEGRLANPTRKSASR